MGPQRKVALRLRCKPIREPKGSIAQLVERFVYIEDVRGSSPLGSTLYVTIGEIGEVAKVVKALV